MGIEVILSKNSKQTYDSCRILFPQTSEPVGHVTRVYVCSVRFLLKKGYHDF